MAEAPSEVTVKIDVDGEEFKKVIDNIAEGFSELGKRIRRLQIGFALTGAGLLVNTVVDIVRAF